MGIALLAAFFLYPDASWRYWTLIGIIPGGVVYTAFGAGLGDLFDAGAEANLKDVFTPTIILALVGLGVLALVPIAVRRWRERTRPPVDTV